MRATQVLASQHRAIGSLFASVLREGSSRSARGRAVGRLAEELIAHMAGEETVFYPALRRVLPGEPDAVARATDEHDTLKVALRRVLAGGFAGPAFLEAVLSMRAIFDRHAREEETSLFPRLERALGDVEQEVLGVEIQASRPPIWMVTAESSLARGAGGPESLPGRVTLPIPAAR
jgi:hemerythrin superfamily protein